METEERDATSRASFKCTSCLKTFTDLEVGLNYFFTIFIYNDKDGISKKVILVLRQINCLI